MENVEKSKIIIKIIIKMNKRMKLTYKKGRQLEIGWNVKEEAEVLQSKGYNMVKNNYMNSINMSLNLFFV